MKHSTMIGLLLMVAVTAFADDDALTFDCVYTSVGNCTLRFDADDDMQYTLVQLRKKKTNERTVFPGDRIKGGYLYYMTACETDDDNNCITSPVYFAPDIRGAISDYPDTVKLRENITSPVDKSTLASATGDYNFYRFVSWLRKVPTVLLMDMVKPAAHIDGDTNFPHMESVIHHDVWTYFIEEQQRVE